MSLLRTPTIGLLRGVAVIAIVAIVAIVAGCAPDRARDADSATAVADTARAVAAAGAATSDSLHRAVQARGAAVMGVDQATSTHVFETLADGGRIVLERPSAADTADIRTIRAHMREIAAAFQRGDFSAPGLVHAQQVPGTAVMAARASSLAYAARDLPRGGEVRITTRDPRALAAVHEFLAFQRADHRAGGHEGMHHDATAPAADTLGRRPEDAVATVRAYLAAWSVRDFARAASLWNAGAPGATGAGDSAAFARAHGDTTVTGFGVGEPGRVEGAAGSRYIVVPVVLDATTPGRPPLRLHGLVTLRRSVVDGASEAAQRWRIERLEWSSSGKPAQPR